MASCLSLPAARPVQAIGERRIAEIRKSGGRPRCRTVGSRHAASLPRRGAPSTAATGLAMAAAPCSIGRGPPCIDWVRQLPYPLENRLRLNHLVECQAPSLSHLPGDLPVMTVVDENRQESR